MLHSDQSDDLLDSDLKGLEEKYLIKDFPKNFIKKKGPILSNLSAVFFLKDKTTGKQYVSKTCIKEEHKIFFIREIKILHFLHYKPFVKFIGFSYHGIDSYDGITILMNYLEEGSLSDLIKASKNSVCTKVYTDTHRQNILIRIAYGLKILHQNSIIHRDMKPENILIDSDYNSYLTDFGLSKFYDIFNSTAQSMQYGTTKYMAPELISGIEYNIKVDIWAFGLIMYEVIYEKDPYQKFFAKNPSYTRHQLENYILECNKPPFPEETNENIKKLILQCLSENGSDRPSSTTIFRKLCSLSPDYMHKYKNIFYSPNEIVENEEEEEIDDDDFSSNPCNCKYYLNDVDAQDIFSCIEDLIDDETNEEEANNNCWQQIKNNCINIFSIQFEIKDVNNDFVNRLVKFFPKDTQRNNILNNLKNGSFKFFNFPIINANLKKIIDNKHLFDDHKIFEAFSIYIFYTWISTCLLIFNGRKKLDFSILLTLLNNIIKVSSNDPQKKNYYDISLSCFIDLVNISIEYKIFIYCSALFDEISNLFLVIKTETEYANKMLLSLSDQLIDKDNKLSEYSISFIDMMIVILKNNPGVLEKKKIEAIISSKKDFLMRFDEKCLTLFYCSIEYIDTDYFIDIYQQMLYKLLFQDEPIFQINLDVAVENENEPQIPFENQLNSSNLQFDLYQFEKINDSSSIILLEVKQLDYFIHNKELPRIKCFTEIVVSKVEQSLLFLLKVMDFLVMLQDENSNLNDLETLYNKYYIIFSLISSVIAKYIGKDEINRKIKISDTIVELLFHNKLFFDQNNTYFTKNRHFELINSIRHFIFTFLLYNDTKLLNNILLENTNYPNLFRECICRIITIKNEEESNINVINTKLCEISDTLILSLVSYRIKESDFKDIFTKLAVRRAILFLLKSLLSNDDALNISFSSPNFSKSFIELLIEPPIRHKLINFLFNYLKNIKIMNTTDIVKYIFLNNNIVNGIKYSLHNFPLKYAISFNTDLFIILSEAIKINHLLSDFFMFIVNDVQKNIIDIDFEELENVDTFSLSLINFLACIYIYKEINEKDMILMESIINKFMKFNIQKEVISILYQLISARYELNLSPSFIIHRPLAICSLIRLFHNTNYIYDIVDFISKLCSFSYYNCIKCHIAKLDILIIEILNEWKNQNIEENGESSKNEFVINEQIIDSFLHLVTQIASVASSVSVARDYFTLMSPVDFRYFSKIHVKVLQTFNDIISISKNYPHTAIPMNSSNLIKIKAPFFLNQYQEEISFIFWVYIPSKIADFSSNAFKIQNNKQNNLRVTIKNYALEIEYKSEKSSKCYAFQHPIPINNWSMISLIFSRDNDNKSWKVDYYINKELVETIHDFPIFIPNTDANFIINETNYNFMVHPPSIGLFLISLISCSSEIAHLYDEGPNNTKINLQRNSFISYLPQNNGECVSLKNISHINDIEVTHKPIIFNKFMESNILIENDCLFISSFVELFAKSCSEYLVMPLFGYLNIPIKCDHQFQLLIDLSISILSNLFESEEQLQISFCEFDGFLIIAGLLENSKDLNITFDLYKKFYNLLNSINYEYLLFQLIDEILMNAFLWSKCKPEEQIQIFQTWQLKKLWIINEPCWFFVVYHNYCANNNTFINECQESLFNIIKNSMSEKEYSYQLEGMCTLCCSSIIPINEKNQILDILLSIFENPENVAKYQEEIYDFSLNLLSILNLSNKNDEIVFKTIHLFIVIREKIVNLEKFILNIICKINDYVINKDSFKDLISLTMSEKACDFLAILCNMTIFGGKEYLEILLAHINQDLDYYSSSFSFIYPSLLLFAFNSSELYHTIINLNIDLFKNYLADFIRSLYNLSSYYFDSKLYNRIIHDVFTEILRKDTLKITDITISFIFLFVFIRTNKDNASILQKELKENRFLFDVHHEDEEEEESSNDKPEIIDIISKISSYEQTNNQFSKFNAVFGLRFNNSEEWLDLDLAKLIFQALENRNYAFQTFQYFFFNIISRYDSDFSGEINNSNPIIRLVFKDITINNDTVNDLLQPLIDSYNDLLELDILAFIKDDYLSILNDNHHKEYSNFDNYYEQLVNEKLDIHYSKLKFMSKSIILNQTPWEEIFSNYKKNIKITNSFGTSNCPFKIKQKISLKNHIYSENSNSAIDTDINTNNDGNNVIIPKHCKLITIDKKENAIIKFKKSSIKLKFDAYNHKIIKYDDIQLIKYSISYHKYSTIEIFTKTRKSYLIRFDGIYTEALLNKIQEFSFIDLTKIQLKDSDSSNKLLQIQNDWINGDISNFEYLMNLNTFSGRSFNDISNYPIFPWIINDFWSQTLDFNEEFIYRNLSLPVGALTEKRLSKLLAKQRTKSYLYDSCYSNPFSVCYYLVRLEPFTSKFIEKNGLISEDSEIFTSVGDSYIKASTNFSVFRELIPEFFFFPEFLINNNTDFNNVVLPPWANNSPFEFIYMHRKALESHYVSSHINEWIDLIWGNKQNGEKAIEANNVFSPEFYDSIYDDQSIDLNEIEYLQSNTGKIPTKLFEMKHPTRKSKSIKSSIPLFNNPLKLPSEATINDKIHHIMIKFNETSSILLCEVFNNILEKNLTFIILDDKGNISHYYINIAMLKSATMKLKASKCNIVNDSYQSDLISSPLFIDSNRLCFIKKFSTDIRLVNTNNGKIEHTIKHDYSINSIQTNSDGLLAVSSKDCCIKVYTFNDHELFETNKKYQLMKFTFKGVIDCISINMKFNTIVCGTNENWLLFYRLTSNKMDINRVVKTKGKPKQIIITDSFGFVVVLMEIIINYQTFENIFLFSINGDEIRSQMIQENTKIICMTKALSSPGSFDYLIVADNENRIYVFEAFYLKFDKCIFKCDSQIIKLTYIQEEKLIVAFCKDGTAYIIYYPIIE